MLQCSYQRGITEMTDVFANKYTYIFKGWIGKGNFVTLKNGWILSCIQQNENWLFPVRGKDNGNLLYKC